MEIVYLIIGCLLFIPAILMLIIFLYVLFRATLSILIFAWCVFIVVYFITLMKYNDEDLNLF